MFRRKVIRQTNNGVDLGREAVCILPAACLLLIGLTGCGETPAPATDVTLSVTEEGFLTFEGGGEEDLSEITRLNEEITSLVDEYRETLQDDEENWTVTSTIDVGERILQGTIYIHKEESSLLSGNTESRQLASFAYDTQEHVGYTAQDALEADPLSGVELATRVQQAFSVLEPDAALLSTDMQGFVLNDDATTEFLYMRIESELDSEHPGENTVEQFYLYDPAVNAMTELTWPTD